MVILRGAPGLMTHGVHELRTPFTRSQTQNPAPRDSAHTVVRQMAASTADDVPDVATRLHDEGGQ